MHIKMNRSEETYCNIWAFTALANDVTHRTHLETI